jgi:hypothetical protein
MSQSTVSKYETTSNETTSWALLLQTLWFFYGRVERCHPH